jgi:hypothetical protein
MLIGQAFQWRLSQFDVILIIKLRAKKIVFLIHNLTAGRKSRRAFYFTLTLSIDELSFRQETYSIMAYVITDSCIKDAPLC